MFTLNGEAVMVASGAQLTDVITMTGTNTYDCEITSVGETNFKFRVPGDLVGGEYSFSIKRGETGYYPSDWDTGDKEKNVELADQLNEQLGVNMWQRQAMEVGSMCGWDVPGADPAKYQEDYVQTGAPAEAQHSRFGGERSSGEMSEPCPQDEAKDMEYGTTMGGMTLG